MSELNKEHSESNFVAYERISVPVKRDMAQLYSDCYKCFGWIMVNLAPGNTDYDSVTLNLKRDRRIKNKTKVCEQQKICKNALTSIKRLENSKKSSAMIVALSIGVVGLSLLVGAVFSFLANLTALFIVMALVGFIGCALPYFVYNKVRKNKDIKVNPLIDRQYDIIYETCETASSLLVFSIPQKTE